MLVEGMHYSTSASYSREPEIRGAISGGKFAFHDWPNKWGRRERRGSRVFGGDGPSLGSLIAREKSGCTSIDPWTYGVEAISGIVGKRFDPRVFNPRLNEIERHRSRCIRGK